MRFHPLSLRHYQITDVDLTGCSDPLAAITAALPAQTQSDLYRIRLTGECSMTPQIMAALESALAPRFCALELRDHTRTPRGLWTRSQEDSLTGLFLRTMAARCAEVFPMPTEYRRACRQLGRTASPGDIFCPIGWLHEC